MVVTKTKTKAKPVAALTRAVALTPEATLVVILEATPAVAVVTMVEARTDV